MMPPNGSQPAFLEDPSPLVAAMSNEKEANLSTDFSYLCLPTLDEVNITPVNKEYNDSFVENTTPVSSLQVEFDRSYAGNPLPSGTFMCDLSHVITQARRLEEHTYSCGFRGTLVFEKISRHTLASTYHYVCSNRLCGEVAKIDNDKEKVSINYLAVLGALSTGSGLSQEEEKFNIMNAQYMSNTTFSACEKTTEKIIDSCAKETMAADIDQEKRLAELRNDIDSDGYYYISVIGDGGWCKRSYGHGYNDSSGVAVIIGTLTQKIVFLSFRNNLSLICKANEDGRVPSKEHVFWKNCIGPSTAMRHARVMSGGGGTHS